MAASKAARATPALIRRDPPKSFATGERHQPSKTETQSPQGPGATQAAQHRSCRSDRAARVAAILSQISITVPRQQRQQQFENYLRDEFEDERRQTIADRELSDA